MPADQDITNALTIDVEDYFQVSAFERHIRRDDWNAFPLRVVRNTQRILEILESCNVKATFYVLGWVAEKCPDLVRSIHVAGHEIGTHSYWHRLIYEMTPAEFLQDLRLSKQVLEDILEFPVTTFRAPSFSICTRSLWALKILAEEGITTDSSIFPIVHDRYGIRGAPIEIYDIATKGGCVREFPPAVYRKFGIKLPAAGGGYFRFFPQLMTFRMLSEINRQGHPFVFYVHPWEFDPEQPRLKIGSRFSRFRHYVNLGKTESRFRRLLNCFRFAPLRNIDSALAETPISKHVNEAKRRLADKVE